MNRPTPILLLSLAVLAACAPIEEPGPREDDAAPEVEEVGVAEVAAPEEGPVGPDLRAFVWRCEDGTRLITDGRPAAQEITLRLPERTVTLNREETASGARYGDGEITFRPEGRSATLEIGDARVACTEDRPASIIESARREGVKVWASGNEPGWNLEIRPRRMVFVTGYGAERVETPAVEPESGTAAAETVYRAATELHTLTVALRDAECVDSMSGTRYPVAVRVELDGTAYQGCGRRLNP